MDVSKILEELNEELSRVKLAIKSLEELSGGSAHRPVKPSAWLAEAKWSGSPPADSSENTEVQAPAAAAAAGGSTAAA